MLVLLALGWFEEAVQCSTQAIFPAAAVSSLQMLSDPLVKFAYWFTACTLSLSFCHF